MNKTISFFLIAGLLLFGCAADTQQVPEQPSEAPQVPDTTYDEDTYVPEAPEEEPDGEDEVSEPGPAVTQQKANVLILGRSVAYAWMEEYMGLPWECDDEECATGGPRGTYQGHYLIYYELDYPPEIARSAATGADTYGQDADTVFFKFCFVDFAADDTLQNARDNEQLVEDVYQYIVVDRGKKLIVGNALPQVSAHTEPALVSNHKAYNAWLDDFAATHDDVEVLDLYGTLADSSGNLKPNYAVDPQDSHLNNDAYAAITPQFMDLLE
jgi:hypothetical protein